MESKPFEVGDTVIKLKNVSNRKTEYGFWTVVKIYEHIPCESGWLVDVSMPECEHCGHPARTLTGYDSHWFVKV